MSDLKIKGLIGRRRAHDFGDLILAGNTKGVYVYGKTDQLFTAGKKKISLSRQEAEEAADWIMDKNASSGVLIDRNKFRQIGNYLFKDDRELGLSIFYYPTKRRVLIEKVNEDYNYEKNELCFFNKPGEVKFAKWIYKKEL